MSNRRHTQQRALLGPAGRLGLAVLAALVVWMAAHPPSADAARSFKLGQRVLKMGSKGTDVRVLQYSLFKLQYPATVDGVFGLTTKRAVKAYEIKRQIPVDGIVQRGEGRKIKAAAKKGPATGSFGEVFPVVGVHNFGGASAAFGAPRTGHIHQGQDVFAACGTKMVAAHGGTVITSSFEAGGYGFYVVIRSSLTGEDFVYSHMSGPPNAYAGLAVPTGYPIGTVGETGNAVGCHLHFEIWTKPGKGIGGAPYNPLPSLQYWDSYS